MFDIRSIFVSNFFIHASMRCSKVASFPVTVTSPSVPCTMIIGPLPTLRLRRLLLVEPAGLPSSAESY